MMMLINGVQAFTLRFNFGFIKNRLHVFGLDDLLIRASKLRAVRRRNVAFRSHSINLAIIFPKA